MFVADRGRHAVLVFTRELKFSRTLFASDAVLDPTCLAVVDGVVYVNNFSPKTTGNTNVNVVDLRCCPKEAARA